MQSTLQLLFWLSAFFLFYTYLGYPLLLWVGVKLVGRDANSEIYKPRISILVIVHNEEARICRKIENLLALDYPHHLWEIVIASDASTDATVKLAKTYTRFGVDVRESNQHRGKPAVLNEIIPGLTGEIVILMDVRQEIEKNALNILVNNFSDARVGGVSGELILSGEHGGVEGVGFYWRYEKMIRFNESLFDSTVGVTGAFYAIRRDIFQPIPEHTILDDVLIPMLIVRQGYRVLFEQKAVAHDQLCATPALEFTRKARTIAGNYQLLWQHLWLLNPFLNRLWFQFISHKLCRLLCPLALVSILVINVFLLSSVLYQITLTLQLLFYTGAIIGQLLLNSPKSHPLFSIPHAFCLLNWCTVAGFYRFIRRQQKVTWQHCNTAVISTRNPP